MEYERVTSNDWHTTKIDRPSEERQRKILKRLWDLENKIEQKTLVELPCKMGDTGYFVVIKVIDGEVAYVIREKTLSCMREIYDFMSSRESERAFLNFGEAEKKAEELENHMKKLWKENYLQ